ncbi:glycosyltransferase family 4 protein [Ferrovibrio sp.]|uniref:glycosyltransferase family 4 protein n=1 Tax=Ferrovibrio sp. TaxID=1917215 RepID=UPI0025C6EAED|nr:glycosyltransferase family 4 protein [Ferrovibrio sp.]MBX3456242.1 glycosyltransferase family 4 protein [Ferrovibrio sp.]
MAAEKLRVLCLDIEGGYGGSSRSLYESLNYIDRNAVAPEVWCARQGPIQPRYAALDIPAHPVAGMPRQSALPRFSRNLLALAQYGRDWQRAAGFRQVLADAAGRFDLIHLNHESLHGLGLWLRRLPKRPAITMHVRTMLMPGIFARWQSRRMARGSDGLVFITENEQARFHAHLGGASNRPEQVIYNIAEPMQAATPHVSLPRDGRLVVACLSNYAWVRGVDRVVDVARALKARGRRDVLFVMAGNMTLSQSLPGMLGDTARAGGDLAAYAARMDVADMMMFLGHVPDPEAVLAASDLLIKPTREDNPWGRDIIEAMAAGRPVLSVGQYDRFVQDSVTGILQSAFDADALAERIASLADDRAAIMRMGEASSQRVAQLCDGKSRAADLLAFWQRIVEDRHG